MWVWRVARCERSQCFGKSTLRARSKQIAWGFGTCAAREPKLVPRRLGVGIPWGPNAGLASPGDPNAVCILLRLVVSGSDDDKSDLRGRRLRDAGSGIDPLSPSISRMSSTCWSSPALHSEARLVFNWMDGSGSGTRTVSDVLRLCFHIWLRFRIAPLRMVYGLPDAQSIDDSTPRVSEAVGELRMSPLATSSFMKRHTNARRERAPPPEAASM